MAGSVRFTSLKAATATGAGLGNEHHSPRYIWSMQVVLGGAVAATGVEVDLEGSFDGGTTYGKLAKWKLSDGLVSGDIITSNGPSCSNVRANLITLTGGTTPNVSAYINGEPN